MANIDPPEVPATAVQLDEFHVHPYAAPGAVDDANCALIAAEVRAALERCCADLTAELAARYPDAELAVAVSV